MRRGGQDNSKAANWQYLIGVALKNRVKGMYLSQYLTPWQLNRNKAIIGIHHIAISLEISENGMLSQYQLDDTNTAN